MPGHAHPRGAEHDPRVDRRPPVARVDASPGPPALAPSAVASSDRPLEPVAVAPDTARGSARVATRPADLLRLQRLAGNAAVAAALRPPRPAPARIPDPARQAPSPAARPGQGHATPTGTTVDAAAATPTDTTVDAPAVTPATVQRGLLDDVVDAAAGAAGGVRDAALQTVRDYARRMPGYELLCVVLARDPVTGQAVPRTATAIIDGFLGLVPRGDALRQQLRDSGAVERAGAWFEQEIPRLGLTWETIRGLFSRAWDALSVTDLLDPAGAWARLSTIFGPPLARLRDFATGAVTQVAEFVLEGAMTAAGGAGAQVMGIVRRAGDVFQTILRDPVGFAGNLVAAVRGGLGQFMTNIGRHLRTGLIGWLTGALGGLVRIPARFDLSGVLGMALELLGLTWANVRGRIVGVVGERAMNGIEQTVEVVGEVRERGLSALTSRIAQFTSGLVETVVGGIRDWVANSVVGAAITKLISMFNPAGAVIQAIIAVYNTVQFFIERAQQLGALANAVFDSISAIASGSLGSAMTAVENALGRTVPVVLGFLSRLIGLGDIAAPVRNIIQRVRTVIDGALDRVVGWIAGLARRVGGAVRGVTSRVGGAIRGATARAGAAARAVGERLGIVRRRISIAGEDHTLIADPQTGHISMASVQERLSAKVERRREALLREPETPDRPRAVVVQEADRLLAAVRQAEAAIAARRQGADATASARLDQLASVVVGLFTRFSWAGATRPGDRGNAPAGLGAVVRYSAKGSQVTDQTRGLFEGEHVIPSKTISYLFVNTGLPPMTESEYREQHVVLIYRSAASLKTHEGSGTLDEDSYVIRQLRQLSTVGSRRLEGSSRKAQETRERFEGDEEGYRRFVEREANKAPERQRRFAELLPYILAPRVRLTARAVADDHAAKGYTHPVHPGPAEITDAATRQVHDIVAIWLRRI